MITISLSSVLELGLIYSFVSLGVYLSFRIINFPDLTVDGSFSLGAAVAAVCLSAGFSPYLAFLFALVAGMTAGAMTGFLHVYFKMIGLLASILVMSALYSINLRIMGQPNIALLNDHSFFSGTSSIWILLLMVLLFYVLLTRFLASDFGLSIRASGMNAGLGRSYGVRNQQVIMVILVLSNGLVASGGALFAQLEGFADVSLGTGTIIIGLASVMIGEAIIRSKRTYLGLFACILGALLYRLIIAFALNSAELGLHASDLNLITTGLVILAVSFSSGMSFSSLQHLALRKNHD